MCDIRINDGRGMFDLNIRKKINFCRRHYITIDLVTLLFSIKEATMYKRNYQNEITKEEENHH
jgi:hypothetical protein